MAKKRNGPRAPSYEKLLRAAERQGIPLLAVPPDKTVRVETMALFNLVDDPEEIAAIDRATAAAKRAQEATVREAKTQAKLERDLKRLPAPQSPDETLKSRKARRGFAQLKTLGLLS